MFKNVFSTLVLVSTLSTFQAKANNFFPDSSNSFSSEELYSGYQWWYLSNEQFFNSEDRGSSIPVEKDADVNVSNYLDKIRSEFKRDVVVAVIDSGADLGHPDINFYTNKAECIDGVRPLSNITDKDENGFAGDCQGWDFTDDGNNPNEDLVKNPLQPGLVGHGTAVAGIIAAKTGNEDLGIAGLSNNIKVYPIKATSNSEKLVTRKGTLGDKFAKAIEYATSLNVDVINVSSGWPSIANSPEVEKALKNAYESGIFVVVATGNDGHDLDYFPCGLPYTICVGSTSPEKTFSEFSNFGGAVDILAPGEHVLSTNARHIYSKKFFNLPFHHYDIRSGTSFSAPVVSALIASLLGLETESPLKSSEEVDEVLGRLYSTAKSIKDENKWSNSGLIDFSKAFEKKSSDHVAPQFKGKTSFLLAQDLTFQYELKLKNYSKDNKVQNVVVEFSSEDFEQSKIVLSNIELSSYELKKIPLSLKAKSSAVDSRQLIAVKVQSEGQEKTYKTRISLEMKTQVAYKFKLHEDLSTARNTALKTPLGTVIQFLSPIFDRYSNYETNDYVSTRLSKKDGKKYLNIFKSTKDGIKPFSVELGEEVDRLYDLQKIDLNYDGKKDYLVITIFTEKNTPESQPRRGHLKLFFLDSDFNSLIDRKYIKYNDGHKAALTHFSDLSFYKAKVDGRDIALPYALANALRPEGAESPLPQLDDPDKKQRIYFLSQSKEDLGSFKLNIINDEIFDRKFARKVGARLYRDNLVPILVRTQDEENFKQGITEVYFNTGYSLNLRYFVQKFKGGEAFGEPKEIAPFDELVDAEPINKFNQNASRIPQDFYRTPVAMRSTHFSLTQGDDFSGSQINLDSSKFEGFIAGFNFSKSGDHYIGLDKRSIFLMNDNEVVDSYPAYKVSLLSGHILNQKYLPFVAKTGKDVSPGLYVDSNTFNQGGVNIIKVKDGKLKLEAHNNHVVDSDCAPLMPNYLNGKSHFTFVCVREGEGVTMEFSPIH